MNETPPRRNRFLRWLLVAAGVGVPTLLFVTALRFPARIPEIDRESIPVEVRRDILSGGRVAGSSISRRHCGLDAFFYPVYDRFPVLAWVTYHPQTRETYYVFIPHSMTDTYIIYIVPDGTDIPRVKYTDGGA